MPAGFRELLERALAGRVALSQEQFAALESHCDLLFQWNRKINLTSITRLEEVVERHYAESVFGASFLPEGPVRVVDVGTGAGFPGVPIAVMRPSAKVALVESHQRKAAFLKESCRGMRNVRVLAQRADQVRETFDWLVSRAVSLDDLRPVLPAARQALLWTGSEDWAAVEGWTWENVAMPWGRHRWLRLGRRAG